MKYLLIIAFTLTAATLWGFFAAPKSKNDLPKIPGIFFALVLFGASVFLLNLTGRTALTAIL